MPPIRYIVFALSVLCASNSVIARNITYKVVSTSIDHNSNYAMGVMIDGSDTPFPLTASSKVPYVFTGSAPIAKTGYSYVKYNKKTHSLHEKEAFAREAVDEDTYNEFYNRTHTIYSVPPLPKLYPDVESMHRVDSPLHRSDRIPTFFLSGDIDAIETDASKGVHSQVDVTYVGLEEIKTLKHAKIQLSGRGTRNLPKASYKLKFKKNDMLFGYKKLKLRSMTTDPSYIREKMAFDLAESFGLPTTRYSFARLFINNEPYGLFGLEEDFSDPWLSNEFGNGKANYKQGTLYNGAIRSNLEYLGESEKPYLEVKVKKFDDTAYSIKAKPTSGPANMRKLIEFTKFLKNAPTTSPNAVKEWNKHIDTDSVLRSLVLEIVVGDTDGYISSGDNYYIYADAKSKKMVYITYDMDLTQGSSSRHYVSETLKGNYTKFSGYKEVRPLLHNILKVPEFKQKFEKMLRDVIQRQTDNPDYLYSHMDALAGLIQEDVAWDKSISRAARVSTVSKYLETIVKKGKEPNGNKVASNVRDYSERILYNDIDFETAINGTINRPTIMGLKEWYSKMTKSYEQFILKSTQ